MTTYGWEGRLTDLSYGRHNKGIISDGNQPPPVEYIEYADDPVLQEQIAQAAEVDFNEFTFGVALRDPTTVEPTTATAEESPGFFEDTVNVVIISVVIIVALLIVLAIVVILVFGMRRKREPTRKR